MGARGEYPGHQVNRDLRGQAQERAQNRGSYEKAQANQGHSLQCKCFNKQTKFNLKNIRIFIYLYFLLFQKEQVLANLVLEEEPGGDERLGEDDSQDESTTGSTSTPRLHRVNVVPPDEDTLPSSLDERESPIPPQFDADSDSSNSSMDIPLLPKTESVVHPKRKAEAFSKESGKIGVTITTSSPGSGSGSPPPSKLPRLLPIKGAATSPSYHVS